MDRSKFKEALNGCTSEQRTMFLYLESLIKETKIKSISIYDYDEMLKKHNYSVALIKKAVEHVDTIADKIEQNDVSQFKNEIIENMLTVYAAQTDELNRQTLYINEHATAQQKAFSNNMEKMLIHLNTVTLFIIELKTVLSKQGIKINQEITDLYLANKSGHKKE